VIGYLHTGMEKTGEELTYVQGSTNVTRMDYLARCTTNSSSRWRPKPCSTWKCPARHVDPDAHGRTQRVSSHLMWMATNGMDLGSTSMMIYGFREREMVLTFF